MTAVQQWWLNAKPGNVVFFEGFEQGLGQFSQFQGDVLASTIPGPIGNVLRIMSQFSGIASILRYNLPSPQEFNEFRFDFRVTDNMPDDSAYLVIRNGITNVASLVPRRESVFDDARRAHFTIDGVGQVLYPTELVINTWYKCRLVVVPGVNGGSYADLLDSAGTLLQRTPISGVHNNLTFDRIDFISDSAGSTGASEYDNLLAIKEEPA